MKLSDRVKYAAILALILVISAFHYGTSTHYLYLHEIYQRIYYIPIVLAAFWYGPLGGLLAASLTSALYIYHIKTDWAHVPIYAVNQYAEVILYHVIAVIIGFLSLRERRQRERLEATTRELGRAYEQVQATFEQLKQSDRLAALGQLSAGVAHEVRNPLGSIKGSIEILEADFDKDHPKREFVDIIKEETARLNSIVSEFLRFARPPTPSADDVSLKEIIDSTALLLKPQAEEGGVTLSIRHDPSLPVMRLDRDQIRQVLLNVMLNGIQAMPGGGTLEVASFGAPEENSVMVEIADGGNGVPPADLDHIFDPFFTTKPHGTGLGLSISYQLVVNHGGRLSVQKNDRGGLTFRISLPVHARSQ